MNPQLPPPRPSERDPAVAPSRLSAWSGSATLRNAAVFMAVVTAGFVVKYLQAIITPLVIAAFLLLLIDGFNRALARRLPRWPDWLRLTMAALLIIGAFTLVIMTFTHYGRQFAGQLRGMEPKLDQVVQGVCERLQIEPMTFRDLIQRESPSGLAGHAIGAVRGAFSGAVLTVIYLGFMLASRRAFGRKMAHFFTSDDRRAHAERVFARVRNASELYMGLQTLKAALVAGASFGIMAAFGLQNPAFLAFLIFFAAYVPIVGGFAGALVPALFGLVQFDSPVRDFAMLAALAGAIFLLENVLMPKLQSDRLNLDPVSILLALGFWGVLLGVPGALLSTPLTVVVMAVASEFDGARWLAVLLSKEGEPTTG